MTSPEHAVLAEDLPLAPLAGDQLVDHPVKQPLAQLVGQPVALGAELIEQRVDQLLALSSVIPATDLLSRA